MDFTVRTEENAGCKVLMTPLGKAPDGAELYRLSLSFAAPTVPGTVTVSWKEPMVGVRSLWHPTAGRIRRLPQWFAPADCPSCLYKGAPLLALIGPEDRNVLTVALSEASAPCLLRFYVDDFAEKNELGLEIRLFTEPTAPMTDYACLLRLDRQDRPYSDAVRAAADWWNTLPGAPARPVRSLETAAPFIYSSWYSFHQDPTAEGLLRELRLAAEAGAELAILDDGWQFDGAGTGDYRSAGEWACSREKFPDMAAFVREAHALGIRLMVWFSVPFAGHDTAVWPRFRDKLLYEDARHRAGILDPRYPEVRDFIRETLLGFVRATGIDGLKLDFIDSFRLTEDSPVSAEGMDTASVAEGVKRLLTGIREEALALDPDFLIEFRQDYVGPAVTCFGDLIRVGDCAYDPLANRIGIADLRLFTAGPEVSSDMLYWSPDALLSEVALQLLDTLFSVPQISVKLSECPREQCLLVERFIRYWRENRELLLHGRFSASQPGSLYSKASAADGNGRISVLYTDRALRLAAAREDIWNATGEEGLLLENPEGRKLRVTLFDLLLNEKERFETEAPLVRLALAPGEHAELR